MKWIKNLFKTKTLLPDKVIKLIGFAPKNPQRIKEALTHASLSSDFNNERLEFLGDAILNAIVAVYLFEHFPQQKEGVLTRYRAALVSRNHLASVAKQLQLPELLHLKANTPSTPNLWGNALEALIGAIYMEKGFHYTKQWVIKHILKNIDYVQNIIDSLQDYKSQLYELVQKRKYGQLRFERTIIEKDKERWIKVEVFLNEQCIASATGLQRKRAEQQAAKQALERLQ